MLLNLFVALAHPAVGQETIDPADEGFQYTWGENVGWLNAEPGGNAGPGVRIEFPRVTGWMWSENLGWLSLSCANTGSCANVEYGVTVGEAGGLSGWAWGENIGWVIFSCQSTASCANVAYAVTIDVHSGLLAGHAWSENVGWISFSCANTASCGSVEWGVRTEVPLPSSMIFADGFESGGTTLWSQAVP